MTEGDILLTSEREGRYSNKKREKKQESNNKKMKYLRKVTNGFIFVHTRLQEQKTQNYITEYRDRLDHAHND